MTADDVRYSKPLSVERNLSLALERRGSLFKMPKKLTKEEFIRRARDVHGDKFDYSKVEYRGNKTKVCIICPIHGEFWQRPKDHIKGHGCPECRKDKLQILFRFSKDDFIQHAIEVHGLFYDYSKVIYTNSNTPVCIICPIHGEFMQRPSDHLKGHGCPYCAGCKKITRDLFIVKSQEIHGDKYDYSKVEYVDRLTPVCIICPIHGEFWQTPSAHLQGKGCSKCVGLYRRTTEEFIADAIKVHGNWYNYSKVEFLDTKKPVCIICPVHGEFWQRPNNHLNGAGCPKCALEHNSENKKYNTEIFIEKARAVHGDRFGYELVDYKDSITPIEIICSTHGVFMQTPAHHLQGIGCPHCRESHGERDIARWLDSHNVKYERQYKVIPEQVLFGRNTFIVDFFVPSLNTIIEFHGEQHFSFEPFLHRTEDRFAEQQDRDRRLREYCKQHKIRLIEIPYTKINNIDKILTRKLLKTNKK